MISEWILFIVLTPQTLIQVAYEGIFGHLVRELHARTTAVY